MRTRAQIGKLLYDNLSNATWIRLREAFLGQELIAVGTEIIYKCELLSHDSPWNPGDHDRSYYKGLVSDKLIDERGWADPSVVTAAVIDWATEVLYQSYLAVLKNYQDQTTKTASYVGLIEKSLGLQTPVPVSICKPATITVMLPVGSGVYPPYSVSIACGSAQFWNISTYRSGEQAVLYQGVPYCYGTDVSGFTDASVYNGSMISVDDDRYVKLTSSALPESIHVCSVSKTYNLYTKLTTFPAFKVYTSLDGSIETHFSDGTWGLGDINFCPDTEDWCIRFLDLTSTEFDINAAVIPDGYRLLAYEQANFTDVDYAQRYFYKWQYMQTAMSTSSDIEYFLNCLPNIEDCNMVGDIVYIKPVEFSKSLIFDEEEAFLNRYAVSPHIYRTICAYPRYFTIQIQVKNSNKFTTELKSRLTRYLQNAYAYTQLGYGSSFDVGTVGGDIALYFPELTYGTDYTLTFLISQSIYRNVVDFNTTLTSDSVQMSRGDIVTAYQDLGDLFQLGTESPVGRKMDSPSVSLAACWGWEPVGTTWPNAYFGLKSREYSTGGLPYAAGSGFREGSGLKAVVGGTPRTMRIMRTDQLYFLNPSSQTSWPAAFITTSDSGVIDALEAGLRGKSFTWSGAISALYGPYFYSVLENSGSYVINRYKSTGLDTGVTSPTFILPSKPTYVSWYNNDVYISCESAQIAVIYNFDTFYTSWTSATGLFVYDLLDADSNPIPAVDQLPWSFNQISPLHRAPSIRSFDFYACVGSDGGMSILTLDAEDPGTSIPPEVSASGPRAIANWNNETYFPEARKKQVNSKWHFYTADKFKVTATGLQTINMREISTMRTMASCNEGTGSDLWVAMRYGWWSFSGRAFSDSFGVTSAYQIYVGYDAPSAVYSLLNTAYYDLINNISTYSESASYAADPNEFGVIETYPITDIGNISGGVVTITSGSYAQNTISAVSATEVNPLSDCYIELSEDIVKWS